MTLSTLITIMQVLKAQINDIWICTYPWCCWWQGAVGKWKRSHHSPCTVYLVDRMREIYKTICKMLITTNSLLLGPLGYFSKQYTWRYSFLCVKSVCPFITWMSCVCLYAYGAEKRDPSGHSRCMLMPGLDRCKAVHLWEDHSEQMVILNIKSLRLKLEITLTSDSKHFFKMALHEWKQITAALTSVLCL